MKSKVDPLVAQGKKVFLPYSNTRAFETRQIEYKFGRYKEHTRTYERDRLPSQELNEWMQTNCGPRGALWTTTKTAGADGINVYFAVPGQAMMFKLAWGGK